MGREGVRDEMGELPMGRCSLLVGLRSSSLFLDQLAYLDFNFFYSLRRSICRSVYSKKNTNKRKISIEINGLGLLFSFSDYRKWCVSVLNGTLTYKQIC